MKKSISNKLKKNILQFKQLLLDKGIKVDKVILFGSQAKGKARKYSDIDLAVISSSFGKDYQNELVKLMLLSHQINDDIEPHPLNPNDLKSKYSALASEIRKHGLLIK